MARGAFAPEPACVALTGLPRQCNQPRAPLCFALGARVAPEGLKARHQEPSPVFALGTRTALEGLKAGQIPAQGSARFALGARVAPAGLKTGKGSSWTFPEHGGNPRGLGLQLGTWHYS